MYDSSSQVREMYQILEMERESQFLELYRCFEAISFGDLYHRFTLMEKSLQSSLLTEKKRAAIVKGVRMKVFQVRNGKKNPKKKKGEGGIEVKKEEEEEGQKEERQRKERQKREERQEGQKEDPKERERKEKEVEMRVREILGKNQQAIQETRKEIEAIQRMLPFDHQYQRYKFVKQVWEKMNYSSLLKKWSDLNKKTGQERLRGGSLFEGDNFDLLFRMVCLKEGFFSDPQTSYYSLRGCEWRDTRGKLVGEIDLVIVQSKFVSEPSSSSSCSCSCLSSSPSSTSSTSSPSSSQCSSSCSCSCPSSFSCSCSSPPSSISFLSHPQNTTSTIEERIVAMVEMKTNFFEIGGGFTQHNRYLGRSDIQLFPPDSPFPLSFSSSSPPPLYLATLVPRNGYKISAPSSLSAIYSEMFRGGCDDDDDDDDEPLESKGKGRKRGEKDGGEEVLEESQNGQQKESEQKKKWKQKKPQDQTKRKRKGETRERKVKGKRLVGGEMEISDEVVEKMADMMRSRSDMEINPLDLLKDGNVFVI